MPYFTMMGSDVFYLILLFGVMMLGVAAQSHVHRVFNKYSKVSSDGGRTAGDGLPRARVKLHYLARTWRDGLRRRVFQQRNEQPETRKHAGKADRLVAEVAFQCIGQRVPEHSGERAQRSVGDDPANEKRRRVPKCFAPASRPPQHPTAHEWQAGDRAGSQPHRQTEQPGAEQADPAVRCHQRQ